MRRIITATVNNSSGVLNRITGVISRRQYNIDSISVGWTEIPNVSRITIVVHVDSLYEIEQVTKQLNKQIDVLKVSDITDDAHIERELALLKINSPAALRSELNAVIEPFRATVIDVGTKKCCHPSNWYKRKKSMHLLIRFVPTALNKWQELA